MRVLFFGTFDERTHPRVRALREGLVDHGHEIDVVNAPLGVSTASRVSVARQPWRIPALVARIGRCWWRLWRGSRGERPEVVVVGYLGHFDVHLARWRFRHSTIVLDHMVSLGDTARDRGLGGRSPVTRLLDAVDRLAIRAADVVVVDTPEQGAALPRPPRRLCVVPVTAPGAWLAVEPAAPPAPDEPTRVIFFGLFTPLQGAPTIGEALRLLREDASVEVTMVGTGQDLAACHKAAAANPRVRWIDWVDGDELPALVARHHVCLGIFGPTAKAQRVVPNKVLQGAAAGCAIITSDTPVQRRALGDAALYVPVGSAAPLAEALRHLAAHPEELADRRGRILHRMRHDLTPARAADPLDAAVRGLAPDVGPAR